MKTTSKTLISNVSALEFNSEEELKEHKEMLSYFCSLNLNKRRIILIEKMAINGYDILDYCLNFSSLKSDFVLMEYKFQLLVFLQMANKD